MVGKDKPHSSLTLGGNYVDVSLKVVVLNDVGTALVSILKQNIQCYNTKLGYKARPQAWHNKSPARP
jgi:hypothetical protein